MKKLVVSALLLSVLSAAGQVVRPNENLITQNIPEIPKSLSDKVRKYSEARGAGVLSIHPDGSEILISTRFANANQLHRVTQPLGARTQLSFFEEPIGATSYDPVSGKFCVYSRDSGGNEFGQLYRLDFDTMESTLLTDGGRSQNGGVVWRKDGKGFFFASTKRNGGDRDIYYMDPMQPGSAKLVLEVKGGGWGISDVSDDGLKLLIGEYISANESHIWELDVATGKLASVTDRKTRQVVQSDAGFSANPDEIWYMTDRDNEFQRLAIFNRKSDKIQYLTSKIPWDVEHFEFSDDKKNLLFVTNEAGVNKVYLMQLSDKSFKLMPELPIGVLGNASFTKDGKGVFVSISTANSSSDVYRFDISTQKLERWTQSELGGINPTDISLPQPISWTSFDKTKITGFKYPAGPKFKGKRPVLIQIHGGPEGQSMASFLGATNYFTAEMGITLLVPNVRGSSGFGKTYLAMDNGMKREDSVKDIGALLDWIATQPDLDKDRVMIIGGSYGGYMTLATAFHYADRIRGSIDIVGISDFNTFLKNTEEYRRDLRRVEYGDERDPKMAAFFKKIAPLNHIDEIKKPMFIIQGTNDPRVPVTEAVQMRDKLLSQGKTVWYLEAKDEGHGFRKKANVDFQRLATIRFMEEFLLK